MNKYNAKDYLPLVQALADGKTIQAKYPVSMDSFDWRDCKGDIPFHGHASNYRIKPEPREIWVNEYPSGRLGDMHFKSQDEAKRNMAGVNAKQVRYREVIE